jgi:outer membrane lipoprotein-sorting protein
MSRRRSHIVGRLLPLVAVAILAVTAASAAAPAPSPAPTVDEIVARHIVARGGLKKIRSIQTLRQKGHATAGPNKTGLVTRELKRPSRTRFEFTVQGVTTVLLSDGVRGWEVSPFGGDVDPRQLSDEVVSEAAEQADIEGPLVDWKSKGHKMELSGRETIGGRECYKLTLTLGSGAVLHEYIDASTFYLLRTESTRQVRGRSVRIETTFGDFKKTHGVLFPRLIEVAAAGRPNRLRVVVDAVELNPPLDDARFELPPAPKP